MEPLSIALLEAVKNGDLDACRELIGQGADVNSHDENGYSLLVWAAIKKYVDIGDLLLDAGAELDTKIRTCQGITLLHHAASAGMLRLCKALLDAGAKVDTQTDFEYTPLHFAAMQGQAEVCRLLLEHGAVTDPVLPQAWWHDSMPLNSAAYKGHVEVVRLLIDAGANLNHIDTSNCQETPLHHALGQGRFEVARMLIQAGADVNIRDNGGNTPLLILLDYDAIYGESGLLPGPRELPDPKYAFLAADELYDLVKQLIDAGADVNLSSDTLPPIEALCEPGREKVRQLLLDAGAVLDPHRRAEDGRTPLHIAAMCRQMNLCRELLQLGADVNAVDSQGRTPWDYAPEPGCNPARYTEVAELLRSHGGIRTVGG